MAEPASLNRQASTLDYEFPLGKDATATGEPLLNHPEGEEERGDASSQPSQQEAEDEGENEGLAEGEVVEQQGEGEAQHQGEEQLDADQQEGEQQPEQEQQEEQQPSPDNDPEATHDSSQEEGEPAASGEEESISAQEPEESTPSQPHDAQGSSAEPTVADTAATESAAPTLKEEAAEIEAAADQPATDEPDQAQEFEPQQAADEATEEQTAAATDAEVDESTAEGTATLAEQESTVDGGEEEEDMAAAAQRQARKRVDWMRSQGKEIPLQFLEDAGLPPDWQGEEEGESETVLGQTAEADTLTEGAAVEPSITNNATDTATDTAAAEEPEAEEAAATITDAAEAEPPADTDKSTAEGTATLAEQEPTVDGGEEEEDMAAAAQRQARKRVDWMRSQGKEIPLQFLEDAGLPPDWQGPSIEEEEQAAAEKEGGDSETSQAEAGKEEEDMAASAQRQARKRVDWMRSQGKEVPVQFLEDAGLPPDWQGEEGESDAVPGETAEVEASTEPADVTEVTSPRPAPPTSAAPLDIPPYMSIRSKARAAATAAALASLEEVVTVQPGVASTNQSQSHPLDASAHPTPQQSLDSVPAMPRFKQRRSPKRNSPDHSPPRLERQTSFQPIEIKQKVELKPYHPPGSRHPTGLVRVKHLPPAYSKHHQQQQQEQQEQQEQEEQLTKQPSSSVLQPIFPGVQTHIPAAMFLPNPSSPIYKLRLKPLAPQPSTHAVQLSHSSHPSPSGPLSSRPSLHTPSTTPPADNADSAAPTQQLPKSQVQKLPVLFQMPHPPPAPSAKAPLPLSPIMKASLASPTPSSNAAPSPSAPSLPAISSQPQRSNGLTRPPQAAYKAQRLAAGRQHVSNNPKLAQKPSWALRQSVFVEPRLFMRPVQMRRS